MRETDPKFGASDFEFCIGRPIMKRYLVRVPAVVAVLGVALVAVAQQDEAARQRWQQWREVENKAIQAIRADGVRLRTLFDEGSRAVLTPEQWQALSEEERKKFRDQWRTRWEEHQKIVADLEQQTAVLKGPRQLKAECDEALVELAAIRDIARQEKAPKAAERIQGLIDRRQARYDQIIQKIGIQP